MLTRREEELDRQMAYHEQEIMRLLKLRYPGLKSGTLEKVEKTITVRATRVRAPRKKTQG